jgi:ribosomal protein S18 acetylase RimI-like enzyme
MPFQFSVIDYSDSYQPAFKALNMEWLEKYNLLEDRDLEALDNPRQAILHDGGVIYLAVLGEEVIGSAAVIKEHGQYELAKMAVAHSHRGKGVSKILLDKCIGFVKNAGAKKIVLYSNSQLQTAIALYRSYGFKDIVFTDSPFVTADVKMELTFLK